MTATPNPRTWSVGEIVTASLMNAEIRDNVNFLSKQPWAEVRHNANQSIANNTDTALNFATELWDTDGMHDTVTNNTRITSQTSGIYLVCVFAGFAGNATGKRDIFLRRSDGVIYGRDGMMPNSTANVYLSTFAFVPMPAGFYVEACVYQNSGGALNVDNTLGGGQYMMAMWMRRHEA